MNWYLAAFKKYAVFSGRARRTEYWTFTLVNFVIMFALNMIGGVLGVGGAVLAGDTGAALGSIIGLLLGFLPSMIFALIVLLPSIAVGVRRLHDTGRSGLWMLIGFVPFVGWVVLLVFALMDSQPGSNQWGENPKSSAIPAMA